jgi:DNA repair protein RadA/Sms
MLCSFCESPLPLGKSYCPACKTWNMEETKGGRIAETDDGDTSVPLSDVISADKDRINLGFWNPVFGGGLVTTSVTIIGGSPGAGKSTWLLQLLDIILTAYPLKEALYVAAEECRAEIKQRADRLHVKNQSRLRCIDAMSDPGNVGLVIQKRKPCIAVIDSIQRLCGSDQEAQTALCKGGKDVAVALKCPVLLVSHVTKDDEIAGSNANQHDVDTTLLLSNIGNDIRSLEPLKNRNGQTNVTLYLEMTAQGLVECEPPEDEG